MVENGFFDTQQIAVTQQVPLDQLEGFLVATGKVELFDKPERHYIGVVKLFAVKHVDCKRL